MGSTLNFSVRYGFKLKAPGAPVYNNSNKQRGVTVCSESEHDFALGRLRPIPASPKREHINFIATFVQVHERLRTIQRSTYLITYQVIISLQTPQH